MSAPKLLLVAAALGVTGEAGAWAQDLEPRRWAHYPVGMNVAGLAYYATDGDVFVDPLLQLAGVRVKSQGLAASYSHWFGLLGKTSRVDVIVPSQSTEWSGVLSGVQTAVRREGLADPWLRLSVNFSGAPALRGKSYQEYRATRAVHTVAGAALGVMLPLGEYQADKLLNLSQNRFIFRPQAGVVHTRGLWSYELTGSAFIFTRNDNFFGGNVRDQNPLLALQTHVVRSFPSRSWVSLSAGYSAGGQSTVNGEGKDDRQSKLLTALSFGLPVGTAQAVKLVYLRGDTLTDVGVDSNSLVLSWTLRF